MIESEVMGESAQEERCVNVRKEYDEMTMEEKSDCLKRHILELQDVCRMLQEEVRLLKRHNHSSYNGEPIVSINNFCMIGRQCHNDRKLY